MIKSRKLLSAVLALSLATSALVPTIAYAGSGGGSSWGTVTEGPVLNSTSNITIQKLAFTGDLPQIHNDGTKPEKLGGEAYNPAKYGEVKFKMVKLDPAKVMASQKSPQEIANAVANGSEDFGPTDVSEVTVDAKGEAKFNDVANGANEKEGFYVIYESVHPATVVAAAVPMFLQLPITNAAGNGYLKDVFLQAKNKVQSPEITFKKLMQEIGMDAAAFKDVEFTLYSGKPGQGTVVKNGEGKDVVLKTAEDGTFKLSDLMVGDYYLVETKGPNVDTLLAEQGEAKDESLGHFMVSKFAQNDTNNKYAFTYTADGKLTTPGKPAGGDLEWDKTFSLVNYVKPTIEKSLADTKQAGVAKDEVIGYKVALSVPENIGEYSKFEYTDVAAEGLTIDTESLVLKDGEKTLVKDTDYTITKNANGYTINFVVNGAISENVKAARHIAVAYNAKVTAATTEMKKEYVNKVTLTYKNSDMTVKDRSRDSETKVTTYGITLTKKDGGRFGLGDGSALPGAEFVLEKDHKFLAVSAEGVYSWVESIVDAKIFTTDEKGQITVTGLDDGEYTFIERKAPTGYMLPQNPETKVTINSETNTIEIANNRSPEMPLTGSETLVCVGSGATVLLGLAAIVMKKKNREEAAR